MNSVEELREAIIKTWYGARVLDDSVRKDVDALLTADRTAVADATKTEVRKQIETMPWDDEHSGQRIYRSCVLALPMLQPSKPALHPKAVEAADEVRRWPTASRETVAAIITRICFGGGE